MPKIFKGLSDSTTSLVKAWNKELIDLARHETKVKFYCDRKNLSEISNDFGGIKQGEPLARILPDNTKECQAIIKFANKHNLPITIRARGYSQGGQTLCPKGSVALDCSHMIGIDSLDIDNKTISCQPGADWRSILDATLPHNLVPNVIPFFPELTVGGVVSVGGVGGNSHIYGTISDNVHSLEIIDQGGNIVHCNANQHQELFNKVLKGVGQHGFITSINLKLREVKPKVRTFYLKYADYDSWYKAITFFIENKIDYLEAFCSPFPMGLTAKNDKWQPFHNWEFSLQVSIEYEKIPLQEEILPKHYDSVTIQTINSNISSFLLRYGARVKNMKQNANWHLLHPWWECIIPQQNFSSIFPDILAKFPIYNNDGLSYRFFVINEKQSNYGNYSLGIALLPQGVSETQFNKAKPFYRKLNNLAIKAGGKRGLAGWAANGYIKHKNNFYTNKFINNNVDEVSGVNKIFRSIFTMH